CFVKIWIRDDMAAEHPISFRDSLTAHTLLQMSLRITAVVLTVTAISYLHIVHTLTLETQDKLQKYIAERGAKESAIFELATDNLQVLKASFLDDYRSMLAPTDEQFKALYQTLPDGSTRLRPEAFDGLRRAD